MAVTLDAALLTAQTAQSRRPVIDMRAGKAVADIPFTGNALANPDTQHQGVSLPLMMSDGRFVIFYAGTYSTTNNYRQLRMVISDTSRTELGAYVEVADFGSDISYIDGFVGTDDNFYVVVQRGSDDVLSFVSVDEDGTVLTNTTISSLATLSGATVAETATGFAAIYFQTVTGTTTTYIRTSTDFETWGSASSLTIPGLTAGHLLQHPKLIQLADDTWQLFFSYATVVDGDTEIFNIVSTTSADLSTWTSIASTTSTSDPSKDYTYPDFLQDDDGYLTVSMRQDDRYLEMSSSTDGWDTSQDLAALNIWVDETNGKLYTTSVWAGAGTKAFLGAAKIDLATWTIDKFYDEDTTPEVHQYFVDNHCFEVQQHRGEGAKAAVHSYYAVCVIDYDADTITNYFFYDYSGTYGPSAYKNVNWSFDIDNTHYIKGSHIVGTRLYLMIQRGYYLRSRWLLGYIDLEQVGPEYDFYVTHDHTDAILRDPEGGQWYPYIFPDDEIVLFASGQIGTGASPGHLIVCPADSFTPTHIYHRTTYTEFPYGLGDCVLVGDTVYAIVQYSTEYAADSHKWGLMELDLLTDTIQYHYPPFAATPGNYLGSMVHNAENSELIIQFTTGVGAFHYTTTTWECYVTSTHEGLPGDLPPVRGASVAYDNTRDWFFVSNYNAGASHVYTKIYAIPRGGTISQIVYTEEDETGFSELAKLVSPTGVGYPKIAISPDDELYATWLNESGDVDNVTWDRNAGTVDLLQYLTGETKFQYAIDAPNRLEFTLSHGHLFDPQNDNSMLNSFLLKGRQVTCRLGETISGSDVWMNHGKFLVRSLEVAYERGVYPTIKVACEDMRCQWEIHRVIATAVSNKTPEEALEDILIDETSLTAGDMSIPSLTGSFAFDSSWMDQYLTDIIDDIAHRFEHFVVIDHDNLVTFRPISRSGTSDRTVAASEVIRFDPDDRYSDFTNKITVTGLSLYDFLILYAEERVGAVSGTVGWWGFNKDFYVYYSNDESKRVKNVRLKVLESSTSIMFQLAGEIEESLGEIDPFDKYCVIEVEAPNLVPVLIAFIATYVAGTAVGDIAPTYGGMTIPVGRIMEKVGLYGALMVLGSVGNFKYEVWGQPVGYIKRQYSASANDTELQQDLGEIIEEKLDGFLCHTASHCQDVADFEMMVTMGQRNRVKVDKIAHLQDEIGDTLTVTHPYTENPVKTFVTNLTRKYKPGKDDGYFIDEIEGWVC